MQKTFSEAEYAGKKKLTRRDRFLNEIDQLAPWALLGAQIAPFYADNTGKRGRPSIGLSRMLRLYVVQQCFGLSEHFGMKAHIGVDAATGLVHSLVTTAANVHDVTQAHALLHGEESTVFADAGYVGAQKREENQDTPVEWQIAMRPGKRKALPDTPEGKLLDQLEFLKAKVRAKVEHPFHVVKNRFHHRKTRYRGLAKNTAQMFSLFGLANLLLAKRHLIPITG
ncbi:IS5 family transposase [Pseudomonas aeruginosa]|uniref:IS5 family transposase n=1 Tax=Pseudomonas aeruginosa TaxID=287 RepID=UPI00104369BC|nr:IS5 family transposase [Pseudomonas aeruginosa]